MVKKTVGLAILAAAVLLVAGAPAQANSLSVNENAAMTGSVGSNCNGQPCGLEAIVVDQGNAYVESQHPTQEPFVNITFRIDPNDITLVPRGNGTPGRFRVMKLYREQGNNPRQHLFATLKANQTNTGYRLAVLQRDNNNNFQFVGEFFVGNQDNNEIHIVWNAGTGSNDGSVEVFRNGVSRALRTGMNMNNWNVDMVRMGAFDEIDAGTAGSIYLDEYVSTR